MARDTVGPFISRFGEAVVYTPVGGAAVNILGIAEDVQITIIQDREGEDRVERVVVRIAQTAALGVVQPARGDAVTFRARDWTVDGWRDEDGFWALELVRSAPLTRSSERHFEKKGS